MNVLWNTIDTHVKFFLWYIIQVENENQKVRKDSSGWELVRFAIIAFLVVVPVRLFIAQPFIVSGSSMYPTFADKDYLIVDEVSYRFEEPKRDDVIIFKYPKDPKKYFIKRIIGLPNETVEINGTTVTITTYDNAKLVLEEPYVKNPTEGKSNFQLEENEYFVMGDNRAASSDSRFWGPVPKNHIVGKAFLRLWPPGEMGVLPGKYEREENDAEN